MYKAGYGSFIGRLILIIAVAVYSILYIKSPESGHLVDSFDLVIHEAGHTIFRFFGQFVQVLAGSAFQIALPLVFVVYFFLRGDRTEAAVLLSLVGINCINVSIYAGDAVLTVLPLLGGDSGLVIHDWNYLLSETGLLYHAALVARIFYTIGVVCIGVSIVGALVSLYKDGINEHQLLRERDII